MDVRTERRPISWRISGALVVAGSLLMMTGCSDNEPVTMDEAESSTSRMIPELQEAMVPEADLPWTAAGSASPREADGACRWSPGDATIAIAIPEDDPGWGDRRDRVNEVLEEYGYPEVGEAQRRQGAPAFGFSSRREDGASISLYSASGRTVIRVADIPVEGCDS